MNCPICSRTTSEQYRPFCSARCANIDLGRWFSGSYAVPAEEEAESVDSVDPNRDEEYPSH